MIFGEVAAMWPFDRFRRRASPGAEIHTLPGDGMYRSQGDIGLEDSEAVFAAVSLLANTLASMPVRIYRGWDEDTSHPLHRLLCYRPNPRMTPFEFWRAMEVCRNTSGNSYALKVPGPDGRVEALDVLRPERVTPRRDVDTGDLWYEIRPESGGILYVSDRDMIHGTHISTMGTKGISPLGVLRGTLDYNQRMQEFSLAQARGVNGAVVLEIPSDVGGERKKQIVDEFMAVYRRSGNSVLVLTGGAKASSINRSVVDAKALEVDKITAGKVARVYGIPPTKLGDYDKASYQSQEHQQLEFLSQSMMPTMRMYEAQLQQKLLTYEDVQGGVRLAFDSTGLVLVDSAARGQLHQIQSRNGLRTIDELRALDGRGPVKGGDRVLVSRDLVPLDLLGKEE